MINILYGDRHESFECYTHTILSCKNKNTNLCRFTAKRKQHRSHTQCDAISFLHFRWYVLCYFLLTHTHVMSLYTPEVFAGTRGSSHT